MRKIVKNIARKIADYLKEIIDDELKIMDAFYQQFA
jgi:predicted DNA-binding protein